MEKKIPPKKYAILFTIVLITVVGVFYARGWYNTTKEYESQDSVMRSVINQINLNEISNYALESQKFVLYVSSGQNRNIKSFERHFKNYIIKNNLQDDIVYINTDTVDRNEFKNQLKNYFNSNIQNRIEGNDNVSLYIFEDGKVTHIINNADRLKIREINNLLKRYGMIDNE